MIKIIVTVLLFPLILTIKFLNNFILLRWYPQDISERVGEFISATEHYLKLRKKNKKKSIDLFFFKKKSNLYLASLRKKQMIVIPRIIIRTLYHSDKIFCKFFKLKKSPNEILNDELNTRDIQGVVSKYKTSILWSAGEEKLGNKFLRKISFQDNKKLITFVNRDNSYLKKHYVNKKLHQQNLHRNSKLLTYRPAIKFLLNNGYKVIRMGNISSGSLNIKHKNYFDYSKSKIKNDFLDLWLISKSSFLISSGTGLDEVGKVFKIPVLYVNFIHFPTVVSSHKGITFPKILKKNKKMLNIESYLNFNYGKDREYKSAGIKINDLNSREILLAVKEMLEKMKNNWKMGKVSIEKQKFIRKKIQKINLNDRYNNKFHGYFNPKFYISEVFLKRYNDWLKC